MTSKISCRAAGYDCDFAVQSESEDEVIDLARRHAEQTHDLELSREDARGLLKDV